MIRFKDKVYEDYSICPVTAEIFDKNGVVQKTCICQGRSYFKKMPVHRIQVYTHIGDYDSSIYDVHHIDENPLNNALSNLQLREHSDHASITNKGKPKSEKAKKNISESCKGKKRSVDFKKNVGEFFTGLVFWNNGIVNKRSRECPGPDFIRGKLPHKNAVSI